MGYAEALVTAHDSKRTVGDVMPAPIGSICVDAAGQPRDSMLPPKKRKHKALEAAEQSLSLLLGEPSVASAGDSQSTASVCKEKGGEERGGAVKEDAADLEADARLALALQEEENVRHALPAATTSHSVGAGSSPTARRACKCHGRACALIKVAAKAAHARMCRPVPVAGDPSQGLKAEKHWQGAKVAPRTGGGGPWLRWVLVVLHGPW